VVIEGPAITVIESPLVKVEPKLSVTLKVIVVGPKGAVGVPEISPVFTFSVRPAGKLPGGTDQV